MTKANVNYGGFLLLVDEVERAEVLRDSINRSGSFSDTLSTPDWQPQAFEIVLLCLGERLVEYAALARKGRLVATRKAHISFSDLLHIEPPVDIATIESRIGAGLRPHLIRATSGTGSRVPPATWRALLAILSSTRPDCAEGLERLERLRQLRGLAVAGPGATTLSEERDAVNVALRIAGLEAERILSWEPSEEPRLAPFLQGLPNVTLREDQMVQHDTTVFGDWRLLSASQTGVVRFTSETGNTLTVMNVNRHPIEECLGVDLLYYLDTYRSYVLIQYKRMTRDGSHAGYRPLDASLAAELERMRTVRRHLSGIDTGPPSTLEDYRLHSGGFYFKLCESEITDFGSTEMIRGMYFPLDYWELLDESPRVLGRNGGKIITRDNCGRHLSNSLLISLLQAGWIGTRSLHSDTITAYISEALAGRRSIMLAQHERPI